MDSASGCQGLLMIGNADAFRDATGLLLTVVCSAKESTNPIPFKAKTGILSASVLGFNCKFWHEAPAVPPFSMVVCSSVQFPVQYDEDLVNPVKPLCKRYKTSASGTLNSESPIRLN